MSSLSVFRRELRGCVGKPVLFHRADGFGAVVADMLEKVGRGQKVHDDDIFGLMGGQSFAAPPKRSASTVAIVPCRGTAMFASEYQPVCFSTSLLARKVTALAADPSITTIVLDIDSPGGMVTGTPEAGDAIFSARRRGKNVTALVNPLAASAAYWLASQANQIVAIKSADVGSVGVFSTHMDCSKALNDAGLKITYIHAGKYKVEGNATEPLSKEGQAYAQSEVDAIYHDFVAAVARGRGVSVERVERDFGQGRCMAAPAAKQVGMIDFLAGSIDDAFRLASSPREMRAAQIAEFSGPTASELAKREERRRLLEALR